MLAVITAHYTARRYADIRPMYADWLLPRVNRQRTGPPYMEKSLALIGTLHSACASFR